MKLVRILSLAPLLLLALFQDSETKKTSNDSDKLPSAQAVIEKFIHAIGGYEILESRSSVHYRMKASKSGQAFEYEVYAVNGKYYASYKYENGRLFERGINNGIAWTRTNGVVRQCKGEELAGLISRHQFVAPAPRWFEMYKSIECQSVESIEDHETYKLHFEGKDGSQVDRYFDTETGLLIRSVAEEVYNTGKRKIVRNYSDHTQMGESIVARLRHTHSTGGTRYFYEVETYEFDVPIPKGTFDLPPEIAEGR